MTLFTQGLQRLPVGARRAICTQVAVDSQRLFIDVPAH